MIISLSIAEKLNLLANGEQLPASRLSHSIVDELIAENIIATRITGRTKNTLYVADVIAFSNYLHSKWNIPNLEDYIQTLKNTAATRADLVAASSDSKAIARRTFQGFLVNSYVPVNCTLNGAPLLIHPQVGTFQFVHDFEFFVPEADVVIVGVENAENFSQIARQQHLFPDIKTLFISRYPQQQSGDVMKWLLSIPNRYMHFGDFDLAGINIYLQEYKKYLGVRASFFIPDNIEALLEKYGNRKLYDQQQLNAATIAEDDLLRLVSMIHKHKKGLEQEALLI
jgi:hypothetical protein